MNQNDAILIESSSSSSIVIVKDFNVDQDQFKFRDQQNRIICINYVKQKCLNGIQCEYSHQIQYYPCANYVFTKKCNDKKCKFDHRILKRPIHKSTFIKDHIKLLHTLLQSDHPNIQFTPSDYQLELQKYIAKLDTQKKYKQFLKFISPQIAQGCNFQHILDQLTSNFISQIRKDLNHVHDKLGLIKIIQDAIKTGSVDKTLLKQFLQLNSQTNVVNILTKFDIHDF